MPAELFVGHPKEAQNTGPAPQTGMEKPGMTNGAKEDGSMDTTGMRATKGNIKRDKDGPPAAKNDRTRSKSCGVFVRVHRSRAGGFGSRSFGHHLAMR